MFKYNSTSQVALYIQHLLRTAAIPNCPTCNPYNSQLLTSDDFLGTYMDGRFFFREKSPFREWEFGEQVLNLTSTYEGSQTHYSTEVHERLGEYLRAYRDYYGIDLMNFYNCYSERKISTLGLPLQAAAATSTVQYSWYTAPVKVGTLVTCFPIKVGARYTIKIYSRMHGEVFLQPAFAVDGKPLKVVDSDAKPIIFNSSRVVVGSQFGFELPPGLVPKAALSKLRYLNLFIQVATTDPLRISVIEHTGYPSAQHNSLLDLDGIDYNVPFSDRLLEYLTGNVITSADPIPQNIERIQNIVSSSGFKATYGEHNEEFIKGRYTENLRRLLYHRFNSYRDPEGNPIPDFLGYVDKDVEKLLWDCVTDETRKQILEG